MIAYAIIEQLPSVPDYNRLRAAVGWGTYQEAVIEKSLPHSLYCVCALSTSTTNDESQVIGMARVIGDQGMVYYIQDVIVLPPFQRQGIGTRMMDKVMAYIKAHASDNTIIGLMAAKDKELFYERYGFVRRPNDTMGAGMVIFWGRN